jgi:PBP1b-binding outer membrane lipoprotein LpoB
MGEKIMKSLLVISLVLLVSCSTKSQKTTQKNMNNATDEVTEKVKKRDGYCSPLQKAMGECGQKKK